jgi:hypothetical protein
MQGRKKHKIKKATGPQGIKIEGGLDLTYRAFDLLEFQ